MNTSSLVSQMNTASPFWELNTSSPCPICDVCTCVFGVIHSDVDGHNCSDGVVSVFVVRCGWLSLMVPLVAVWVLSM